MVNILDQISHTSMGLGAKRRALGLLQVALEGGKDIGLPTDTLLDDTYTLANLYEKQGKGTGVKGAIGEALGDPLTYIPLAGLLGKLGLIGTGAVTGGAAGFLEPKRAADESRGANTAIGTAGGAILSPVAGYATSKIGGLFDRAVNRGVDAGRPVVRIAREGLESAADFMRGGTDDIGIDIDTGFSQNFKKALADYGDDAIKLYKSGLRSGLSKEQAATAARLQSRGIPLTRGDITQDFATAALEEQAATGALGDAAKDVYTKALSQKKNALYSLGKDTLRNITGGDTPLDETFVASQLAKKVRSQSDIENKAAGKLIRENANAEAFLPKASIKTLHKRMTDALTSGGGEDYFDIDALPTVKARIADIQKMAKGKNTAIKYQNLDNVRRKIGTSFRTSPYNSPERVALGKLYNNFNKELDDLINSDLIDGDVQAIDALRNGYQKWGQYRQKWFGKNGDALLGKIISDDLDDKQVVNLLAGSSALGNKNTHQAIKQIKNTLGADSPEYKQFSSMFFERIVGHDLGVNPNDPLAKPIGSKMKSTLDSLMQKNRKLFDELFTPDQQRAIIDMADAAYLTSTTPKGRANPSGSANSLGLFVRNLLGRATGGASDIVTAVTSDLSKGAVLKETANKAIRSIETPLKSPLYKTNVISRALSGVTTGGIASQMGGAGTQSKTPEAQPSPNNDRMKAIEELKKRRQQSPPVNDNMRIKAIEEIKRRRNMSAVPDLQKIIQAESSGNPNAKNPRSSASGLLQFTDGTWNSMVDKYGADTGITKEMKSDPEAQKTMGRLLMAENRDGLKKALGREPNTSELYVAHFAGITGAKRLLKAKGKNIRAASMFPSKVVRSNPEIFYSDDGAARTPDEVIAILSHKVS